MFLQWQLEYHPFARNDKNENYAAEYMKDFAFNEDSNDLVPQKKNDSWFKHPCNFRGSVVLTPQVRGNMLTQFEKYLKDNDDPAIKNNIVLTHKD